MTIQRQRERVQPGPATQPTSDESPEVSAMSDLSRRAAALAQIAQEAWHDCAQDVEAELEARRNASGQ